MLPIDVFANLTGLLSTLHVFKYTLPASRLDLADVSIWLDHDSRAGAVGVLGPYTHKSAALRRLTRSLKRQSVICGEALTFSSLYSHRNPFLTEITKPIPVYTHSWHCRRKHFGAGEGAERN